MQTEILFEHLCDKHNNCWEEVCWKSKNPELESQSPNLTRCSNNEKEEFKKNEPPLRPLCFPFLDCDMEH